jgi:hypothetical protein
MEYFLENHAYHHHNYGRKLLSNAGNWTILLMQGSDDSPCGGGAFQTDFSSTNKKHTSLSKLNSGPNGPEFFVGAEPKWIPEIDRMTNTAIRSTAISDQTSG